MFKRVTFTENTTTHQIKSCFHDRNSCAIDSIMMMLLSYYSNSKPGVRNEFSKALYCEDIRNLFKKIDNFEFVKDDFSNIAQRIRDIVRDPKIENHQTSGNFYSVENALLFFFRDVDSSLPANQFNEWSINVKFSCPACKNESTKLGRESILTVFYRNYRDILIPNSSVQVELDNRYFDVDFEKDRPDGGPHKSYFCNCGSKYKKKYDSILVHPHMMLVNMNHDPLISTGQFLTSKYIENYLLVQSKVQYKLNAVVYSLLGIHFFIRFRHNDKIYDYDPFVTQQNAAVEMPCCPDEKKNFHSVLCMIIIVTEQIYFATLLSTIVFLRHLLLYVMMTRRMICHQSQPILRFVQLVSLNSIKSSILLSHTRFQLTKLILLCQMSY